MFDSASIVLDLARRPGVRLFGIPTELALRAALSEQVPALVQTHLQFAQPIVFLGTQSGRVRRLRPQRVLLGDQVVDPAENVLVVHQVTQFIPCGSGALHHAAPLYRPLVTEDASAVVRLLAEPARLRVFAAVVLGRTTPADIATVAGLDIRDVLIGLRKLADGGLVTWTGVDATPIAGVFVELARQTARERPREDLGYTDDRVASVVHTFVRDGRLVGLPAARHRRIIVLEHLAQSFEPGIDYPETEVNAILERWSANSGVDHISLRRYLVDEDLLRRADGIYRRSGGWTDVAAHNGPQRTIAP